MLYKNPVVYNKKLELEQKQGAEATLFMEIRRVLIEQGGFRALRIIT